MISVNRGGFTLQIAQAKAEEQQTTTMRERLAAFHERETYVLSRGLRLSVRELGDSSDGGTHGIGRERDNEDD